MTRHSAIILAAGNSRRMGRDKARLPLGAETVVERVIANHRAAGARQVIVVGGRNIRALREMTLDATVLENRCQEQGMLSSVQTGLLELDPLSAAFFVHPVDIPLVAPAALNRLCIAADGMAGAMVLIPTFNGHRGHPPLIRLGLREEILAYTGTGGLRAILQQHTITEVPCREPGVLWDMDTPEAYHRLLRHDSSPSGHQTRRSNDDSDPNDARRRCTQGR